MTPERWKKIDELAQAALERGGAERASFLDEACAGDDALRHEVESQIAYQQQASKFLEEPAFKHAAELIADRRIESGQVRGGEETRLVMGTQFGPYEILSRLGAGGMGEVYRARDSRLRREVAIKVLRAAFSSNADGLRRFEQEARAAGALNHPNILAIFDIGSHDNAPYVVSELLEGETLGQTISASRLKQSKAIDYALQIARGLAAAHDKGIVHRDLKPDNIFITRDGRAKVLDFGLAKLTEVQRPGVAQTGTTMIPSDSETESGTILGTTGYMSPEQVRGEHVDHRSDIFSFGAVLYEMLTGKRAFRGDTAVQTMNAILTEEPPGPSETNSAVSPALERIIQHCLEKRPEQRFQSVSDLAFQLESLSVVSGASKAETALNTMPARRNLWPILGLGLALLTFGAVAGILLYSNLRRVPQPSYKRLTFSRGTVWNARFTPDGQTLMYSARWNGNPLDVFSTRAGKTESRPLKLDNTDLLAISGSNELAVLRNRQYLGQYISRGTLARMPIDGGAARDILEDVQEADWSPDGTKLAVVRWVNGQNQLEYPIGKMLHKTAGYISHPRISPKGDLVAFMDHQVKGDSRGWVAVVDLTGKKTVLSGEWSGEEGLAWSPDGDEVWFTAGQAGDTNAIYSVTLSGRERLVLRMTVPLILHDISRDGRLLITSYNDSQNLIGHLPGETKERDLSWLDLGRLSDLSPNGKEVLFTYWGEGSGINYAVYLRRTDGTPAVRLGDGTWPRLSPDGKLALATLFTPPQLALLPTGAGETRSLERGPIEEYSNGACWFPDGRQVVFQGREPGHDWRCYLQSIEGGPPRPITIEGTTGTSQGILISPDGRFIIVSEAQHQRYFYPVAGGTPQPILYLESEDEIIGWSSDGRSLYLARTQELPIRVYRFDPATGRKELLKEVIPADRAGIFWPNSILMTPDGKGYAYSVRRVLSDLYLVEGLK
jgi:serine/threonine protein kinase